LQLAVARTGQSDGVEWLEQRRQGPGSLGEHRHSELVRPGHEFAATGQRLAVERPGLPPHPVRDPGRCQQIALVCRVDPVAGAQRAVAESRRPDLRSTPLHVDERRPRADLDARMVGQRVEH
jgi:hypothetical protein